MVSEVDRQKMSNINVRKNERYLSVLSGVGLVAAASRLKGIPGLALGLMGLNMLRRGIFGHAPLYKMLGRNPAVRTNPEAVSVPHEQGIHVVSSLTINKPAEELYSFWRNFENLPQFMHHLKSVTVLDDNRSRWEVRGPAGSTVAWEAEIVNEVPNEVIGWRSLADSQIANAGSVRFMPAPGGRGTEVKVTLEYAPPAGKAGQLIAGMFGENPEHQIKDDLHRFQQLMETGEIATNAMNPEQK